jgi:transposase
MRRFELSDIQWEQIQDLLPGRIESVGRTALNNRTFVNGVLWVLRSGARWHDLPERYGNYKSLHKRFSRWAANGVWEKIFDKLLRDRKNHCLMVDSTVVRAHQQASTARKNGGQDKALGRSRGGLTTKIHLLADDLGLPVDFTVTAGQVNDCTQAIVLLGGRKAKYVLADKGYDSDAIVKHIETMSAIAVIPSKSNRKKRREYDKNLYKQRNRIERCFSQLKHFRRFATRYEKLKTNFRAFVTIACCWLHLQLYVDTA